MASWSECNNIISNFIADYSLLPHHHEVLYKYAMEIPEGGMAMELGICGGRTSALLGYCAREKKFEAHGIDAFILLKDWNADSLKLKLESLNLPYIVHDGWTTEVAARGPVVLWDRKLDLLIIDASHNDPWVSADFDRWTPFLKTGGIGVFDDVDPDPKSPHYDVFKAVTKYTSDWEDEFYDGRLLIRRKT
jgi:hypothetical protein